MSWVYHFGTSAAEEIELSGTQTHILREQCVECRYNSAFTFQWGKGWSLVKPIISCYANSAWHSNLDPVLYRDGQSWKMRGNSLPIFPVTECQSQSRAQAAAEHRGEYFRFNSLGEKKLPNVGHFSKFVFFHKFSKYFSQFSAKWASLQPNFSYIS